MMDMPWIVPQNSWLVTAAHLRDQVLGSYYLPLILFSGVALFCVSKILIDLFFTKKKSIYLVIQIPFMLLTVFFAEKYRVFYEKQLLNEKGIAFNLFEYSLGTFPWVSEIIPQKLYLGALPLENLQSREVLATLGVTAIVSVVEDEEFEPKLLSYPVRFKKNHPNWLHITSPDHHLVSHDDLKNAAAWIKEKIAANEIVYVHCKSGKGRSVSVVAAYLGLYAPKWSHMEAADIFYVMKQHLRPPATSKEKTIQHVSDFLAQERET